MNTPFSSRYRACLPLFLVFVISLVITGCASEQFKATTDLENFQKMQHEKNQENKQSELQTITSAMPDNADSPGDYILGAGDLITVSVFETDTLNAEVRVSSRGFVRLPLLDNVEVANMTAAEAEEKIERLYAEKYLRDPHVTVYIKERVSKRITLIGAVGSPGTYDYVSPRPLLNIIALANGLKEKAGSSAFVTRHDSTTSKGVTYLVDLEQLIKEGKMDQNFVIRGGDVIYIPEAGKCFIDGAVRKPGTYSISSKMTITEGIAKAGGLASFADRDGIKLIRSMRKEGKREIIELSYNDLQTGRGDSILLEDQDIIFAESSSSGILSSGSGLSFGFMGTGVSFRDPQ